MTGSPKYAILTGDSVSNLTAATGNLEAGMSQTYTVQLQDASGNNLTTAGQVVNFYLSTQTSNASTINGSSAWSSSNPYTVTTNSQGQATVTVAVPSGATGSFTLDAWLAGQNTTTASGKTVSLQTAATTTSSLIIGSSTTAVSPISWPTGTMNGGEPLSTFAGSDYINSLNAVDAVTNSNDQIQVTTSNKNVLSIGTSGGWTNPSGDGMTYVNTMTTGSVAMPTVTAGQPGTATLTITDLSTPNVEPITETVTVVAGSAADIKGINPDGTTNTAYTFPSSGVSGAFTIEITDAAGNSVNATYPTTLTSAQVLAALGASSSASGVRTSVSGSDVTNVTIPQGQPSVTVYLDGVTSNTSTSATALKPLSNQAPVLQSASVSGSSLTLTFNNPVESSAALTTQKMAYTVADSTTSTNITGVSNVVISGDTVTLTLTGPGVAHDDSVTVAYATSGGLQSGYGAPVATIGATTVTNNN
jgi:hypothetical protein